MQPYFPDVTVVSYDTENHGWAQLHVGIGQGSNFVVVNSSGAVAKTPLSYPGPTLTAVAPDTAPTRGGTAMTLTGSDFGLDPSVTFTCDSTFYGAVTSSATNSLVVSSPQGQGEGCDVRVEACGDVSMPSSCLSSEAFRFNFSAPRLYYHANAETSESYAATCFAREGDDAETCVAAHCTDACGLGTEGGARIELRGDNFGRDPPSVFFGNEASPSVAQPDDDNLKHEVVYAEVPPGAGTVSLRVAAGGASSNAVPFRYDAPVVESVSPNAPVSGTASSTWVGGGESIEIYGSNFGASAAAAGDVRVYVGGLNCTALPSGIILAFQEDGTKTHSERDDAERGARRPRGRARAGTSETDIWQYNNGNPFLRCFAPLLPVGPASLEVSVAGRNGSYPASAELIAATCPDGYYGQRAGEAFTDETGACEELCGATCANASTTTRGCAEITPRAEYCLPCPAGSTCDTHAYGYVVEPYALEGYYRLDLRDDNEISCGEYREHRPEFCYAFEPCSPSEACTGDNRCERGYTHTMCARCCSYDEGKVDGQKNPECWGNDGEQLLFHRAYGRCVPCPKNLWLLVGIVASLAVVGGAGGWFLKKKKVNLSIVSIGVDYFQILSIFASTNVAWPPSLQHVYHAFSLFSFNLLNIFPPECSVSVAYETQWVGVMYTPRPGGDLRAFSQRGHGRF